MQGKGKGITDSNGENDEDYEDNGKQPLIPKETAEKIKKNAIIIKAFLKKLTQNSKLAPLLVPVSGFLWGYEKTVKTANEYKQKAKTKSEKMMADEYAKAVEEIIKDVNPDVDIESMSPEELTNFAKEQVKNKDKYRDKVDALVAEIKKKGTKKCPEYAQYRAYKDYFAECDKWIMKAMKKFGTDVADMTPEDRAKLFFGKEMGDRKVNGAPANAPTGVGGQAPSMYQ